MRQGSAYRMERYVRNSYYRICNKKYLISA